MRSALMVGHWPRSGEKDKEHAESKAIVRCVQHSTNHGGVSTLVVESSKKIMLLFSVRPPRRKEGAVKSSVLISHLVGVCCGQGGGSVSNM